MSANCPPPSGVDHQTDNWDKYCETPQSQALDAQAQQPDYGAVLDFFEVDLTPLGGTVHRLVNSIGDMGPVSFQGFLWAPVPLQCKGWAWDSTGNAPRPEITIADVDGTLLYESLIHQDLVGMKVTRWQTTTKLKDQAYRGPERWLIIQKKEATGSYITFMLGTVVDARQSKIPGRQMFKEDFPALGRQRGV